MRRIVVVVLGILLTLSTALACGDKLLVLGRGVSFAQIHKTDHPASILIYMSAASQLPAADKDVQLQTILKLAGHKPKSIEERAEFLRALTSEKYDFVVAGPADAGLLKGEIAAAPSKPMLLTLLYKPSNEQLSAAQKQFTCAFKAERNNQILHVVDEAMKSRQGQSAPKCLAR